MVRRYRALRILAGLYKALAILIMTASVLGAVALVVLPFLGSPAVNDFLVANRLVGMSSVVAGIVAGILALLIGVLGGLPLLAFGQLVDLLISLEESTRVVVHLIQEKAAPEAAEDAPPPDDATPV